ncbi:hypothetical protein, partial [Nocardia sp. 852002-51244_SCH5132740]|uniref:hypothetical protein n=1 Tax=Nocardia sp. 852002-51244_SCH5132740 TaxID=1834099 RepID=UPI001E33202A
MALLGAALRGHRGFTRGQRGPVIERRKQSLDPHRGGPAFDLIKGLDHLSALAAREAAVTSERRTQQRQAEIER